MSAYLQRLFDRGAAFVAAPPAATGGDVLPAGAPTSPAFGFDQRLADPELAQVYSILGVSPDPQAFGEWGVADAAATPLRSPGHVPTALPVASPSPGGGEARLPGPHAAGPPHRLDSLRPAEAAVDRAVLVVPPPPAPVRGPREAAQLGAEPARPVASMHPAVALPRTSGVEREQVTQVESTTRVEVAPSAPALLPAVESASTPAAVEPAPASLADRPALAPRVLGDAPPMATPRARTAATEVEPPRRSPVAIESAAPAAIDGRQIERIARDAVRAELARRHAETPRRPPRATTATSDGDAPPRPASRPMTAREASVIGELEPSSSPLTIFGLRRR